MTDFSGLTSDGVPVGGNIDGSGTEYFVDGNFGNDGNVGQSWLEPFKTFAAAIAASNIDIARGADRWARRNTIFLVGDRLTEDITTFPDKCDVVGKGSVDSFKGGAIVGTHAVTSGTGTRFFDMGFEPGSSADMFTFTGVSGIEFHNCEVRSTYGAFTAVSAIDTTNCIGLKLFDNLFRGEFSGDVIDIGAGAINHMEIIGNKILGGANDGIIVTGTTTITGGQKAIWADNYIQVANVTMNDGADGTIHAFNNRLVSAGNFGATSHVLTAGNHSGNLVTAANGVQMVPIITDIEA